ncbi:hypothetical protein [Dolichospermum compactum]|uniref:hypothetical protein n=1 Tax=Dolichospermum compactum TaxID=136073 RepID=UPI001561508E|nr:hypothetical protein [Dolichospermum compactum]
MKKPPVKSTLLNIVTISCLFRICLKINGSRESGVRSQEEEGRRKKEKGRRKKEEGKRKKEKGRRKKESE